MAGLTLTIDPAARKAVRLGWLVAKGLKVGPSSDAFWKEAQGFLDQFAKTHAGLSPAQVPAIARARTILKSTGLDPTRHRIACEALFRRAAAGKGLYRINNLIDLLNVLCLKHMATICAHDLDAITPPVTVRAGRVAEFYSGIDGKGPIELERRVLVADATGPFGNPIADSDRAKIKATTKNALVLAYLPADTAEKEAKELMEAVAREVARQCGGKVGERGVTE
jgi:DNA/RNA-binding domain of Phe-tRNA-synthetase-like protein